MRRPESTFLFPRECFKTQTRQWERSEEIAFYISTTHRTAEEYNTLIRNHWGIENKTHYVRDNGLREDHSRIRKNPGIMARLRSFSLNVLRANGVSNIAHTLYKNALNLNNLAALSFLYP